MRRSSPHAEIALRCARHRIDARSAFWWPRFCLGPACAAQGPSIPSYRGGRSTDALAVSDTLEALIAVARYADRQRVRLVRVHEEDTAPSMFARAAVTGRLVQQQGLLAAHLVPEVERCARRSQDIDPNFRDGAATRLLGTLYVMAPAALLEHGDSEVGLQLLEGLVQTHPAVPENHLRLAEAYIALGDPAPARPHLCNCLAHQAALRLDDQRLLRSHGRPQLAAVQPTTAPACWVAPTSDGGSRAPMEPGDPRPAGHGTASTARPEAP
jgi:hypothetical protein